MARRIRIALWSRVVLVALYLVGIVVQFIAAGYGFFEGSFEFHEGFGWTLMHLIPLLVLIATLVLWRGGRQLWLALAVGILGILQPILATIDGIPAILHPLNALVLFVLGQALLGRDLREVRGTTVAQPPPVEHAPAA